MAFTPEAALHAIEQADRGPAWDQVRSSLFGLTDEEKSENEEEEPAAADSKD